jgi:hypothetical protein
VRPAPLMTPIVALQRLLMYFVRLEGSFIIVLSAVWEMIVA